MQLSLFQEKPLPVKNTTSLLEEKIHSVLGPRLPGMAVDEVVHQVTENPVSLMVVRHRTSKSGDYRPAQRNHPPRITVNGNLNPYAFLITLVHELAHHQVELDHAAALKKFTLRRKKRPLPHGDEWKSKFRLLMEPYMNLEVFPADLLATLFRYMKNPKASSAADHHLSKVLKQFDPHDNTMRLEEIPFDAVFSLHGRRHFRKKEKMRTRFKCICMQTNRVYLVSANAPVEMVNHD